jgi:hypothetical protein
MSAESFEEYRHDYILKMLSLLIERKLGIGTLISSKSYLDLVLAVQAFVELRDSQDRDTLEDDLLYALEDFSYKPYSRELTDHAKNEFKKISEKIALAEDLETEIVQLWKEALSRWGPKNIRAVGK